VLFQGLQHAGQDLAPQAGSDRRSGVQQVIPSLSHDLVTGEGDGAD
jgi:hypothetical protein